MHASSVADVEEDIIAAGAQLIWVLEQGSLAQAGTATLCRDTLDDLGSDDGWCVGDSQTSPTPGTFDNSPFSIGRGFDLIVQRDTMELLWTSSHGTPSGNENLTGADVLAQVQAFVGN